MATPLYKGLKQNSGQTTYIFPSVSEDISLSNQNDNYKMNFSKFALLDLDLSIADANLVDKTVFPTESPVQTSMNNGDLLVNQLRNYVANQDVTIRQSLLNTTTNFYNPLAPLTVTERIFWKWARKAGLIQYEPATPNIDYIDKVEYQVDSTLDPSYFKEYLWKERQRNVFDIDFTDGVPVNQNVDSNLFIYTIYIKDSTNLKNGDKAVITIDKSKYDISVETVVTSTLPNNIYFNNQITIHSTVLLPFSPIKTNTIELDYHRTIQYIGNINAINNVVSADKSYTEVTAYVPDMNGQTPTILFRVKSDENYSASLQYPILPTQQQPEIIGAEQYDSPINLQPQNYPGDVYAYFDSNEQTYLNSTGLTNQKSGDFYGVKVPDNSRYSISHIGYPYLDGTNLDGVTIDFDYTDYTGMNQPNNSFKTFDEYSSAIINGISPKDFKFNAILWYYDIHDTNSNTTATNLYGITFVTSVNNETANLSTLPKYVADNTKDGISYIFNLNLNFNINTDQLPEKFDEEQVFSMFGFDKYNAVINNINKTNNVYDKIAASIIQNTQDISNLKSLVYNNANVQTLQAQITAMSNMINLYQRNQIGDSDTITTYLDNSVSPALIRLNDISTTYSHIYNFNTSNLYNQNTNSVLYNKITVPKKDFLVNIINNDNIASTLSDNLTVVLNSDLANKQTATFVINTSDSATNFKKLNINVVSSTDSVKGVNIIKNIELPVVKNLDDTNDISHISNRINSEIFIDGIDIKKSTNQYFFTIKLNNTIMTRNFVKGDVIYINNFRINYTSKNITYTTDLSGQYEMLDNSLIFVVNNENSSTIQQLINDGISDISGYLSAVPSIKIINKHYITITKNMDSYIIKHDIK